MEKYPILVLTEEGELRFEIAPEEKKQHINPDPYSAYIIKKMEKIEYNKAERMYG